MHLIEMIIVIFISFLFLYFGADFLIKGARSFALVCGLSRFVIGLTVVAYLTSAPELIVSVFAAVGGHGEICLGNIIGANIFNILAVLGISAIITPLAIKQEASRIDIPFMILISCIFGLLLMKGEFSQQEGVLFLFATIVYTVLQLRRSKPEADEGFKKQNSTISIILMLLGSTFLTFGSRLLLDTSITIAKDFEMCEETIAVTLIAIGTSLPELAIALLAGIRKQNDILVGNIIGSNIINILAIVGLSSLIEPLQFTESIHLLGRDAVFMVIASLWLYVVSHVYKRIGKVQGVLFIAAYMLYLVLIVKYQL